MIRVLTPSTDQDALLVAMLMIRYGLETITLSQEEADAVASVMGQGLSLVVGNPQPGQIEARWMLNADVPGEGDTEQ